MSRVLILVLAVLAFVWLLRRALGSRSGGEPSPDGSAKDGETDGETVADLVACAHCGVLVPRNLAFVEVGTTQPPTGRLYCSDEHRRLGPG